LTEPPADGLCIRCRARVPLAETYEHWNEQGRKSERWHRQPAVGLRVGVPCGQVFVEFVYRVVWHCDDRIRRREPIETDEQWDALEREIADEQGLRCVKILIREEGKHS